MMVIFFQLLQMSLAGSFAVFYLLILRVLLGKLPKKLTYVLWGLVGIHLIFVVVPDGRFAIIPDVDIVQELDYIDANWNMLLAIYLTGIIAILLVSMFHYHRLADLIRRTAMKNDSEKNYFQNETSVNVQVYYSNSISSAFTMGYFLPKIYLPEGLDADTEQMIICHEMVHIRRKDHFTRLLAFVLCALNWFNPVIWCAYYFFMRDQETSCDELALQKIGLERKKQYAETILNSASDFFLGGGRNHTMAFGEANIKYRIRRCVKAVSIEKKKYAAMFLLTAGFFILGIFVSSVFRIDDLSFIQIEQTGVVSIINNEKNEEFQMRGDGIYHIDEQGEKLIYHGSLLVSESYYLEAGGLFFMTQDAREVRYLDINTYNWEKVFRCSKGGKIDSFIPHSGFIWVYYTDDHVEVKKVSLKKQSTVTAQEILNNPGRIYNVTRWKSDGAYAFLDLNSDGKDEEMFLDFSVQGMLSGSSFLYSFSLNSEEKIKKEVSAVNNEIYAVSLDGEHIYIALTDSENASDEKTTFYRYEDGSFMSCGQIPASTSAITFSENIAKVDMFEKVIYGESYVQTWCVEADGSFVENSGTDYISFDSLEYDLKKDIELHTEPESGEVFHVVAQRVGLNRCLKNRKWKIGNDAENGYWAELTLTDGTVGWIFISNGKLENGDAADEVFSLAVYVHTLTEGEGVKRN